VEEPGNLEFNSKTKNLGCDSACVPYGTQEEGWYISEVFQSSEYPDFRNKGIGRYHVNLRRDVASRDEIWKALSESIVIAKELDVAWCYAWGKPYFAVRTTMRSMDAPDGWSGNLRDVERQIESLTSPYVVQQIGFSSRPFSILPVLPLRDVMTMFRAIRKASAVLQQLIRLHISSFKTPEGQLFLLAKGLEFVGAFWASGTGGDRSRRNNGILAQLEAVGAQVELTRSINWLFEIANTRYDVRHVWNRESGTVHNSMTAEECTAFVFNANLVIHAFVCTQLGVTPRVFCVTTVELHNAT